jgi:hypothetical protein
VGRGLVADRSMVIKNKLKVLYAVTAASILS